MTRSNIEDTQLFLKDPEVQSVTSAVSENMRNRTAFKPAVCSVFNHALTKLEDLKDFRFEIDAEARRQLPAIIDNKVQAIVPAQGAENEYEKAYRRRRKIGIVFSGGPAPGGHNVIAGLFANSMFQIFKVVSFFIDFCIDGI